MANIAKLVRATLATGKPIRLQVRANRYSLSILNDQYQIETDNCTVVGYAASLEKGLALASKAFAKAWVAYEK